MKVIRINAVYGRLSTGRTAKQLDEGLKQYGGTSLSVFAEGPDTPEARRMNTPMGIRLHSLLARLTGKAGYFSRGATKKLLEYIDSERPDVVHLHNLHGNYINLPMLFSFLSKRKLPVVVTLHDCWWYTGKCCHYTVDGCMKWQEACGGCPRLKKDVPSWFFDRTARMLEDKKKWFAGLERYAVIGVSDWIVNEAKKSFLGEAAVIERVYNWVDTEVFRPQDNDVRRRYGLEGKFVMLAVSNKWTDDKGLGALLELASSLEGDERLVMVGRVPEDTAAERLVTIPQTHDQNELAQLYSAADVFISLSPEESFGKVTAEALACDTPVLTVDSTASPELVGENCGEVLTSVDPACIRAAAHRAAGLKTSAPNARRSFALENFDMRANIEKTLKIYKKLIGE